MKRTAPFIALLAVLSAISGYMMSKVSLIGRVGMSLMYKEYNFLKVWWQGGALIFGVLLLLFLIQFISYSKLSYGVARMVYIIFLCAAVGGLWGTYFNFREDLSHRWLGERFHVGVYIFWLSWMLISLFFLTTKPKNKPAKNVNNTAA